VTTKNRSIPAALDTVITVITEKQGLYGENRTRDDNHDHHDAPPSLLFSKDSRESSIEFVTGDHGDHSDHSRTNPDDFSGHLELLGDHSDHSRTNPEVLRDKVLARDECRWHFDHGERVPRALCAGCRHPIASGDEVLDLADDNRVHLDADYRCLIAFGERWRSAARAALARPEGA
jgi:hypothetical protein